MTTIAIALQVQNAMTTVIEAVNGAFLVTGQINKATEIEIVEIEIQAEVPIVETLEIIAGTSENRTELLPVRDKMNKDGVHLFTIGSHIGSGKRLDYSLMADRF